MATSSPRIDTFNRAADPICEAEAALAAAKARLEGMFANGQKLEPPLNLFQEQDHTADPLRRPGKATYLDPVADPAQDDLYKPSDLKDYNSFAEELDRLEAHAQALPRDQAMPMSREEAQAQLKKELDEIEEPELVFKPPPPSFGPGLDQGRDDERRALISDLQKQLEEPHQAPETAPEPSDPLAPEPIDQARADYLAAAKDLDIEPE